MNDWLLTLLVCPSCGARLGPTTPGGGLQAGDEALICEGCAQEAPVVRGIPRFVDSEQYADSFGFQWTSFPKTQLDTESGRAESEAAFTAKTGIAPSELEGLTVLDAGCGMGRFAEVCAAAGAQVVGADLSSAVEPAARNLARFPSAAVVQADLFDLPFAHSKFDLVYSIGVLHHTPDPNAAFDRLTEFVKPGGVLAVWVYSREPRDRMASGLKYFYRRFTPRMDRDRLLRICRVARPLYRVHRVPVFGFATRKLMPTSMHPDPEWRVLDTFDDYSPRYRFRYTYDEVQSWFEEAGFVEIEKLAEPVAVRGRRPGGGWAR